MLNQILCPVDREHLCSPKPELTTQKMFLLRSLGDGCPVLMLLSPVLMDRAALLYAATDGPANQQAARLAMPLHNRVTLMESRDSSSLRNFKTYLMFVKIKWTSSTYRTVFCQV